MNVVGTAVPAGCMMYSPSSWQEDVVSIINQIRYDAEQHILSDLERLCNIREIFVSQIRNHVTFDWNSKTPVIIDSDLTELLGQADVNRKARWDQHLADIDREEREKLEKSQWLLTRPVPFPDLKGSK